MEEEGGERGLDEGGYLLVRIHVPELNVQKCLQFPRDQLVWDVKQQCLAALPKVATWFRELKESFNYGLFSPPENGRAGKFLDEERRLGDYPFNGPVGYLELKYKRRVYKTLTLDEKQLKSLHTRANLRRFLDYVHNGQVEKITKMCSKGLDPNFHCQDSGETPLTIATGIKKPSKVLIALVNGGALLDYRTKDGSTAMHRSIEHKSLEAMKTLLELGASPNYKDGKGLTPLYLTITHNVDPQFTETLLHDHATTGAQDLQGWQEVHQACKIGLLQHLEHLLFYGADMNARNASGNTPLHVCAVNGQESCARQLLFRGADRQALNYANQTPCQVAVIAGNMELAEIIQNYRQEDVVPYRGPPSYNPKRRSAIGWLNRVPSMTTLALPPSPCPSDRSSAPFSSASSSLSDGSSAPPGHETDTASIVTVLALGVADKSLGDTSDIISDSSGVGTANSDTTNCSLQMPGTTVVCIESYTSKEDGHLNIREGDIIEVTGATDDGYLEGNLRSGGNKNGLFPAHCVQEVKLRHHNIQAPMMMVARDARPQSRPTPPPPSASSTITTATITTTTTITKPATATTTTKTGRVLGRRESTSKHFATAPRVKKTYVSAGVEPRTVVLHRGRKGFGFILRGAKATSPLMELTPSEKCPALQYLDDVDPGGVADIAGLRKGDFLLEINNEDVSSASHEHVVDLIRKSGDLVQMTVISLGNNNNNNTTATIINNTTTMPISKSTILPGGGNIDIPTNRQYATLPRKMSNSCGGGGGGTLGRSHQAPLPPRRDPKTTLTVSRARAKSMVAGLETGEKDETDDVTKSSSAESIHQIIMPNGNSTPIVQPRTASIRQRPTSSRITSAELEELFQRQKDDDKQNTLMTTSRFQGNTNSNNNNYSSSSPTKNRVYASVAEMKRSKSKNSKVRFSSIFSGNGELRRDFHSTPDITQEIAMLGINNNNNNSINNSKHHRSQEDLFTLMNRTLPPPTHPPPPPPLPSSSSTTTTTKIPPVVQVVKVDISRNNSNNNNNNNSNSSNNNNNNSQSEYNNLNNKDIQMEDGGGGIVSSFRPTANAKLYASPEDMKSVGYRSKSLPSHSSRPHVRKSHSMRTNSTFKPTNASTPSCQNNNTNMNPYAQPIKALRSNSTAGSRERRKKIGSNKSPSNLVNLSQTAAAAVAPPIPEPDYSCSDTDGESDEDRKILNNTIITRFHAAQQPIENSGNSNTSGSSSGSSSVPHSFSVEEIQKGRSLLKSSKSYPDDFLKKQNDLDSTIIEDGDNSSSGVSSDQELPTAIGSGSGGGGNYNDRLTQTLPSPKTQRQPTSLLSRHAVSLAQLPPPIEADSDEKEEFCLPPPPEFDINNINEANLEQSTVLAPPPQFSDNRQVTRVRIVGAVPKTPTTTPSTTTTTLKNKMKQGRLHSQ